MTRILAASTLFFCAYAAFTTALLVHTSDANKARHAVEQTQFVCLGAHDRILTGADDQRFTECLRVTYRRADEAGVR